MSAEDVSTMSLKPSLGDGALSFLHSFHRSRLPDDIEAFVPSVALIPISRGVDDRLHPM